MISIRTLFILIVMLLLSTGCAQSPASSEQIDYSDHQLQLSALNEWQLKARVSIRTPQDAFTASLFWQQRPTEQTVELNGMLGQNYARIQVNPEMASLRIQDDQVYKAKEVDELMINHLGYIIPVTAMTNWLKGSIAGTSEDQWQTNEAGFVKELQDRGWRITYKRYDNFPGFKELQLPSRMTFTNGRETIKVAVQSWSKL